MTPVRTLALIQTVVGAGLIALNHRLPDESRTLGIILIVVGALLAIAPGSVRIRRTAELLSVTMLVLIGGELTVRWQNALGQRAFANSFVHFVDDPELRYELEPDTRCSASTTNSLGMLDRARQLANPEGALRIACLGDSVGGDCLLPTHNVCAALETAMTAKHGAPVEVLNFSVPGYNTIQEARALETKAAPFSPEAVVVLYVINDPYPDLAISHHLPGHLKFEHLLYSAALGLLGRIGIGDQIGKEVGRLYDDPRAWAVVENGFARIAAVGQARKIPVIVAIFPMFLTRPSPSLPAIYRRVAAEATRHGLIAIDLSERAYKNVPIDTLLKPSHDPIHPNAQAHRLAAEVLSETLLSLHPEWVKP